ncbi:hypothetical protein D3C85_1749600 [compost metagenome]
MEMLGYRFICCQHEFFNDHLGNGTFTLNNIRRFSIRVHQYFRFHKVKINRSALHPLRTKFHGQLFHPAEVLD